MAWYVCGCVSAAESMRPVKDCFLAILSSHGEEGCVFGADGKPVLLSRIFRYFDNDYMEKKTKLFLIQVQWLYTFVGIVFTFCRLQPFVLFEMWYSGYSLYRHVEERLWMMEWKWIQLRTLQRATSFRSIFLSLWILLWCTPHHLVNHQPQDSSEISIILQLH